MYWTMCRLGCGNSAEQSFRKHSIVGNIFAAQANFFVANQATTGYLPGNLMEGEQDITSQLAGLGFRLRDLRAGRGWTLEELAERTGLSKPFLSRLEAGGRQPPFAAGVM